MVHKPSNFAIAFHIGAVLYYWLCNCYMYFYVHIPVHIDPLADTKFSKFRFLTVWNFIFQSLLFLLCLLKDVAEIGDGVVSRKIASYLKILRDLMFPLVFSLSVVVSIAFWGLYAFDRELIFPKAQEPYYPSWVNHAIHTNIVFFNIAEMYIEYTVFPSRKFGVGASILFTLLYATYVHALQAYTGLWVYPFLAVISLPLALVWHASILVLGLGVYFAGEKLNEWMWGYTLEPRRTTVRRSKTVPKSQ